MRFSGAVFRAHNPEWAWDPVSGEGARRFGGRFNKKARAALYTALSPLTAIREASPFGRPMEPITLCEYEVDCAPVLDARDAFARAQVGISDNELACPDWELRMLNGQEVPSQALAERLIGEGYAAMIVPSFARGAGPDEANCVFWSWGPDLPVRVHVVDTHARLPKDRSSWQ